MKTKLLFLILVLLSLTTALQAADRIELAEVTLKPGNEVDLKVSITQEAKNYTGLQFDLKLADGLSLALNSDGKLYSMSKSQPNDLVCEVENFGNNSYRFVVYSNSLKSFGNGEVMKLRLKAKSGMELKTYSLKLSQIALSDANGQVTKLNDFTSTVKVTDSFTLTYVVDGATYKSTVLEYGASITPEVNPTKEGYTFSGWSKIPATMPAHDVTVNGTFSINKYKLVYKVDGEVYKTYEIEYGAKITPEAAPTKMGYTFSGWSEIPATMPANDVAITGTFTVNKYKLTYKVDGETDLY